MSHFYLGMPLGKNIHGNYVIGVIQKHNMGNLTESILAHFNVTLLTESEEGCTEVRLSVASRISRQTHKQLIALCMGYTLIRG